MLGDDLAGDPESEPRALAHRLGGEEALEDSLGDARREPRPRVLDREPDVSVIVPAREADDTRSPTS